MTRPTVNNRVTPLREVVDGLGSSSTHDDADYATPASVATAIATTASSGGVTTVGSGLAASLTPTDVAITFTNAMHDGSWNNLTWSIQVGSSVLGVLNQTIQAREKASTRTSTGVTMQVVNTGALATTTSFDVRVIASY